MASEVEIGVEINRRVASGRKRLLERIVKTPKRFRGSVNNRVNPQMAAQKEQVTGEKPWIDNSFMSKQCAQNGSGSGETLSMAKIDISAKERATGTRCQTNHVDHDDLQQNDQHEAAETYSSSNSLFSNDPLDDPVYFVSQHESFNDTDPLFANIDMDQIEKQHLEGVNSATHPIHTPPLCDNSTPVKEDLRGDIQGTRTTGAQHSEAKKVSAENIKTSVGEQIPRTISDTSSVLKPVPTPTVPKNSFRDRIKKTLHNNAKVTTVQRTKLQDMRRESLEIAMLEAVELQHDGTKYDIGPFFGLPSKVQDLLEKNKGITKLYDWQKECLSLEAIRSEKNLIYSLPTSGGKTLVAEILIFRELLLKKRDAILILPFVSLVQEKVRGISAFALDLDFLVEEYAASKGQFPPRKRRKRKSLYICTIEKANSLVNSLIEAGRLEEIGLVVVDELHMLGEGGSRGACLEMTLTKVMHSCTSTEIIGMSATLNNISDLQKFLSADVYSNDFRPVKLVEHVKMDDTLYEVNPKALCPLDKLKHSRITTFQYSAEEKKKDPDQIAALVLEVVPENSCLVFCATKKNCENVAELLCRLMARELTNIKKDERRAMLKALYHDGNGEICPVLRRTVPYGVAYHHSGLTMDERKLIEEAYSVGTLCVLCCTSTLAAGVNLPAKRVILRSPYIGQSFLSSSQYKQMVGRAGRAGIDTSGESILVIQKKDKQKILDLVSGPYEYCQSSLLFEEAKGLRSLLLTTIGLKITPSLECVKELLKKTLFYLQSAELGSDMIQLADSSIQQLLDIGLVTQTPPPTGQEPPRLEVTHLGRATFKGSIDIDRAPMLYRDLCQASESLVVANHLHLLYLVTPYDLAVNIKPTWLIYLDELSRMDSVELRVATLIGVSESYVAKRTAGQKIRKPVDEYVVQRFYLTLVIYNLWKQKNIWEVSAKFHLARGFVQQLLTGAASFAACVTHFCQELEEFWVYQDLFANFVKKLSYCVTMELIPLMEIPGVKIGRARQLFNAGYKNLQSVAHADPENLVKCLEHLPRKAANQIVTSAKVLIHERAESLREEAEEMTSVPQSDLTENNSLGLSVIPTDSQLSVLTLGTVGSQ